LHRYVFCDAGNAMKGWLTNAFVLTVAFLIMAGYAIVCAVIFIAAFIKSVAWQIAAVLCVGMLLYFGGYM